MHKKTKSELKPYKTNYNKGSLSVSKGPNFKLKKLDEDNNKENSNY